MSNKFKSVKKDYWSKRRENFFNKFKKEKKISDKAKEELNMLTITERVAFVIDGEVVDVISCQPKLAAILLSEPLIIDVNNKKEITTGYKYQDGEFIAPVHEHDHEHHDHQDINEKD